MVLPLLSVFVHLQDCGGRLVIPESGTTSIYPHGPLCWFSLNWLPDDGCPLPDDGETLRVGIPAVPTYFWEVKVFVVY